MSGPVVSDAAKRIDLRYAELISRHQDREAMVVRGRAVFKGLGRLVISAILWLFGKSLLGRVYEIFWSTLRSPRSSLGARRISPFQ